jgi:AcrR family transcriptional regulator
MAIELDVDALTPNQAARRQRVIDAAMKLAADGGYDAVQMRDVAREAGVALGTIYRYFASKDHLLAACQVEFARAEQHKLERQPPRGETPADRVVDVLRRATRAQEREPQLTAAMVTAISSPDPAVSGCQREVTTVMAAVLAGPMRDVDPKLRPGIVRALSHVWFSALLGWVNGWTNVGAVGEELESAARLLLRDTETKR